MFLLESLTTRALGKLRLSPKPYRGEPLAQHCWLPCRCLYSPPALRRQGKKSFLVLRSLRIIPKSKRKEANVRTTIKP